VRTDNCAHKLHPEKHTKGLRMAGSAGVLFQLPDQVRRLRRSSTHCRVTQETTMTGGRNAAGIAACGQPATAQPSQFQPLGCGVVGGVGAGALSVTTPSLPRGTPPPTILALVRSSSLLSRSADDIRAASGIALDCS
jgi:hypothetical protein